MGNFYNREADEKKRRNLRRQAPPAEVLLWQQLRGRQLGGFKFRRQFGIGPYIADFCGPACYLVVELDGASHESEAAVVHDTARSQYLESNGFLVVRFTNDQVYWQRSNVLENLLRLCEERQIQSS